MTACETGMVMAEDFSANLIRYNDNTDETYILKHQLQKNQLPIVKYNMLFLKMLSVASFNFS